MSTERIRNILRIFLPCILLCSATVSQAQWYRFHGNAMNTGAIEGAQGRNGTYSVLWTFPISGYTNSSPALADLDDDGLLEVIIAVEHEALYALNGEDGSVLWSYPLPGTSNNGAPVINDLDNDSSLEVAFATVDSLYVFEGENGNLVWSIPVDGFVGRSPATGDLDGDGIPEVIYACWDSTMAFDGETGSKLWSTEGYGVADYSSPVAEDTDMDGSAEVMVCSEYGTDICLLDGTDGSLIWETPIPATLWDATPAPAFADLNLDGYPEIVGCAGDNDLYVLNAADGSIEWIEQLPGCAYASPCLLDLDGNDSLEIVVSSYFENELLAYTCTGNLIWTASITNSPLGTPAVADIDGDQVPEIVQTSCYPDGAVQIFDAQTGNQEWIHNFGAWNMVGSSPAAGDLDGDGFYDFVLGCHDGNIYAFTVDPMGIEQEPGKPGFRSSVSPNPFSTDLSISIDLPEPGNVSISVYDLAGHPICSVEDGLIDAGNHMYVWSGRDLDDSRIPAGIYLCEISYEGTTKTLSICKL